MTGRPLSGAVDRMIKAMAAKDVLADRPDRVMSMKLVCPKCLTNLKVPVEKVPADGGWARCPKCGEKFYVQPPGKALDLLSEPPQAPPTRKRPGRDESSQMLLNQLRAKKGEKVGGDPRLADFKEVTIFPEPATAPGAYQALGAALLALPIIVLAIIFFKSDVAGNPPVSYADFNSRLNDEFNPDLIRTDLLQIRQRTTDKKRLKKQVDFSGSESRVFKYFAADMVPGVCDSISWLDIESDMPPKGFAATAVCVGGILERLRMQVNWTDRTAIISFPGYSRRDQEVDLFP